MKSGMIRTPEQDDIVVKKFQEAMGKFSELDEKVLNYVSFVNDLSLKLSTLIYDYQKLSSFSSDVAQTSTDNAKDITNKINNVSLVLDRTGIALNDVNAKFGHTQSQISEMNNQIKQLSDMYKGFAAKEDINSVNNDLKAMSQNMMYLFQSANEKYIDNANSINSLKTFSSSIHKDVLDQKDYAKKIVQSLDNLISMHHTLEVTSQTAICDLKNELVKYFDEKIAAIPKPVIPSLDDAKKAVDDKIYPAILDAKNANLRSSNNESKIYILEKKVEQLQLLLNKLQLQG